MFFISLKKKKSLIMIAPLLLSTGTHCKTINLLVYSYALLPAPPTPTSWDLNSESHSPMVPTAISDSPLVQCLFSLG